MKAYSGMENSIGLPPVSTATRLPADQKIRVLGPEGRPMTMSDLPPADTRRWGMKRKAEVIAGVRAGLVTLGEACQRYGLSVEEFMSWQNLVDQHGIRGLRATRIQKYRKRGGNSVGPSEFDVSKA